MIPAPSRNRIVQGRYVHTSGKVGKTSCLGTFVTRRRGRGVPIVIAMRRDEKKIEEIFSLAVSKADIHTR